MASLNRVFLIGNLTKDPELRYTPGGTAVAELRMAVNQKFVNRTTGEQKDDAVFVSVTVWGKQAEACGQYLKKGSSLFVEGRLQLDTWEGKDGQKRNRLRVVAFRAQFMGRPKSESASAYGQSSSGEDMLREVPDADIGMTEEVLGVEDVPAGNDAGGVPF